MDKELLLKLAEMYKKVEDFERAYLSPKSVFTLMNKAGIIDDEEKVELHARYEHTVEPIRKKGEEIQKVVYSHAKQLILPFFKKGKK